MVPAVDEGPDLDHQLADRGEGAAADGLAFDDAEPDLDKVEPRSRGRREVNVDPGVRCQPGLAFRVLVGGVVVHDQMQLLVGVAAGEVAEKDQELLVRCRGFQQPVTSPVAISSAANSMVVPRRM